MNYDNTYILEDARKKYNNNIAYTFSTKIKIYIWRLRLSNYLMDIESNRGCKYWWTKILKNNFPESCSPYIQMENSSG